MTLATKNGSIIVKDGKLAENCGCCCPLPEYSKFEWTGSPPAAAEFCECYWNSAPVVKSINECGAYAGIPLAGLSRGRQGNLSQSSLSGTDGSASGYPTGRNIEQIRQFNGPMDVELPGRDFAYPAIRVTQSALYLAGNILIGLHSPASGQAGVLDGASVANPYMSGSGHGYRISPVSLSVATDLREAQKGRSLKYCDGTWIADPQRPWKVRADVAGPPTTLSELPDSTWGGRWSHEFSTPTLLLSTTGLPILWSAESSVNDGAIIHPYWTRTTYSSGASTAIVSNEARPSQTFVYGGVRPAYPSCDGCKARILFSGSISRRFVTYSAPQAVNYVTDTIYFDEICSPCLSQSGSWSALPTRRNLVVTEIDFVGRERTFPLASGYGQTLGTNPGDLLTFSV